MRRRVAALTAALALVCSPAAPAHAQDAAVADASEVAEARAARAADAWEASRWDEARREFTWLAARADAPLAARAEWHLGALDEQRRDFAAALAHYERSAQLDPGGRFAGRSDARIDYLRGHAAGGFTPLAELQALRQDPRALRDDARLDAVLSGSAGWTDASLQAEARLLVAAAWARRGSTERSERVLRAMLETRTTPREARGDALRLLEQLTEARGDFAGFARDAERWGADPPVLRRARQRARRARVHVAARGLLAALLGGAVALLALALRRGRLRELARALRAPLPWVQLGLLCVGGGVLARTWGRHDASPFWALATGVALLYVAAVEARVLLPRGRVAGALKVVCFAAAVLAAAFEATYRYDQGMLEGVGL